MSSPPRLRVRRERDRQDETERQSQRAREVINDRFKDEGAEGALDAVHQQQQQPSRPAHPRRKSTSASSTSSLSASSGSSGCSGSPPGAGSGAAPTAPAGLQPSPTQPSGPLSHASNRGPPPPHLTFNNSINKSPSEPRRPAGARELLPSYNTSGSHTNTYNIQAPIMDAKATPRSPGDDLFPPNKVDIDAARYREAQQQAQAQNRRNERGGSTRDRPTQTNTGKDLRDRRPTGQQQVNGRSPAAGSLSGGFHGQQRPVSPESLSSPSGLAPGTSIQRLPTPSVANSVLQPLDAKVAEYGTLMSDAQDEMAHLDEEMRALQDRQREAEQRFLEAKAKHDDYRRQYNDVEKALRGEYPAVAAATRKDRERGGDLNNNNSNYNTNNNNGVNGSDEQQRVGPTPSMPDLQHYGQAGASGSGNLLNGNGGHPGMRSQRTVSIQSEYMDGEARPGSKRGRWSKLFGV
ncbi:hypothetical protein BD289DRAFT_34077 [Coniella lustricola]|uniref:Uncharacterized protein n=1 Tax=Coniella lustricola TaxID=2025994 RepID=A0A2T3A2F7_9PEZI|nr:hypothetical protein BD289DRAFT_34077 [Coniella lustricola]